VAKLGRLQKCLAWTSPAVDALLVVVVLLSGGHGAPASFGWTMHMPIVFAIVRLAWMLVAILVAVAAGAVASCSACGGQVNYFLELLFPYCSYGALGVLGVAHLITDQPAEVEDSDLHLFWLACISGTLCITGETWCLFPALELLKDWTSSRSARSVTSGHSVELLSDVAGDATNGSVTGSVVSTRTSASSSLDSTKEGGANRPTVKKLFQLVWPDWPLLIQATVLLAGAAIAEVLIPHYIGEAISIMIKAEEAGTLHQKPFARPVVELIISAVACGILSSCRGATFIWLGGRASVRLRGRLFRNLARQDIGFFDTTKTGELTSRMTQDCQKVTDQITLNVNVFLRTLVQMITTLFFMYSLAPPLMWASFVSIPVIVALSKKYGGVMQTLSKKSQEALADANAVAEEDLSSMATVRMFAAEYLEELRFTKKLLAYQRLQFKRAGFYVGYLALVVALPYMVTSLVIFYGGKLASEGEIHSSVLLSFVFYLQTLNSNFSSLGDFYTSIMDALGSASRVFNLLDKEPELHLDPPQGEGRSLPLLPGNMHLHDLSTVQGRIELRDLHFTYPARPEVQVLKGLSLTVEPGNVVALVGPSGNGKSTVIGLLTRLYKAQSGSVTLDGVDVWDYSHNAYHQAVSIVGQEPVLYSRTIRENIVYGLSNPGETITEEAKVEEACSTANAHTFISQMPDQYETHVGERGVQLSGGQKQRIAIARALVRKPRVLLLDEATSALDTESEKQVQQAIDSMIASGQMTVIIIAHRLSTVKNSNKICVVKGGGIVEEGRHQELLDKQGEYFQLVESQLSHRREEDAAPTPAKDKKEEAAN